MNEFNPNWGITIPDFSKGIKLSLDETNKLLTGDFEINDDLAQKLGEFFGNSTQFWINREGTYRKGLKKGLSRV